MALYAHESALPALENAALGGEGERRISPLVALAWHLRQRDSRRAESLAGEALVLGEAHPPPPALAAVALEALAEVN